MKNCISYLFSVIIVGLYILSTMGYGVHECSHDGTKNMMVLFGESPCEHSHSKARAQKCSKCKCCACCGSAKSAEESAEHGGKCCTTEVYVLTQDQVNSQNASVDGPVVSDLYAFAEIGGNCANMEKLAAFSGVVYSTGFTKNTFITDLHISISQFRI